MKVVELHGSFGLENLGVEDRPEPEPGEGQVLVRMKAASLNFRDLLMVRGLYNPRQPLPIIPCSDGAGEVVEAGPGVTRVRKGDRVTPTFFQGWFSGRPTLEKAATTLGSPLNGVLAEYMVVREDGVVPVPGHLSFEQAATLPCAALTAWSALVVQGSVKAGDTVLVQGTGGVALFALRFAKMLGARVIVISSSDEKLARARSLGADHGINYQSTPRWGKAARDWTGGVGVDHIVELGGAGTLPESLQAIGLGGRISLIGVLAGASKELNILPIVMRNVCVQGIFVGHREGFEEMNRAIELHGLTPVIDRVFPMEEARQAFEWMAGGNHFGKICLQIP
jgi:NADPH:quinone reductase-like Zn-dependent oxidoreductase